MTDAIDTPVRRARREQTSADFPIEQKPDIILPTEGDVQREPDILQVEAKLKSDYLDELKFNEEPVTILIYPTSEPNAPIVVDCWVNGQGAEVFVNGNWLSFGCLPVGVAVTTRRKYVGVLLGSKIDTINTKVDDEFSDHPKNRINRTTSSKAVLTIIGDKNPRGSEWLQRMMRN